MIREVHTASKDMIINSVEIIPSYVHVLTHRWTKSLDYQAIEAVVYQMAAEGI